MRNQVQLITYVDRLSGGGLAELNALLTGPFKDIFGGMHILPFFYPIDGADAGFDPIDHTQVDPKIGDWSAIQQIAEHTEVMGDIIVNHMSDESPQFKDFSKHGTASNYNGLFLTMKDVFPNGATEADLLGIYRPRPGMPFQVVTLEDGSKHLLWTTFTAKQIDINVHHPEGVAYLESILERFKAANIKAIRLDAAGYAIKKAGTSCFMIPETFDFIDEFTRKAHDRGMEVLVEIHSYYQQQIEIAKKVDFVYDFALPPLILHAIYNQTGDYLKKWLDISPRNCITVLDTHDGIGVIDIGPHSLDKSLPGLVPNEDIDRLVEEMHERSGGQSRQATGEAASNLDLYQVNSTYYDVLARNDAHYLMARAIQFFAPGIPQVYYTGFLAEPNDMDLLARTNVGRDINRHYFSDEEVVEASKRPVVQRLIKLIRWRNHHPAFSTGQFEIQTSADNWFMTWTAKHSAQLEINWSELSFSIHYQTEESEGWVNLEL